MNCWEEIKFMFTDYCSVAIFSSFFYSIYVKSRISIRPAAWETPGVLSFPLPWLRIAVIQTIYSPHPLTCAAGRKLPHSGNILEALQNYRTIHLKNTLDLIKGSRSIACCIKPLRNQMFILITTIIMPSPSYLTSSVTLALSPSNCSAPEYHHLDHHHYQWNHFNHRHRTWHQV